MHRFLVLFFVSDKLAKNDPFHPFAESLVKKKKFAKILAFVIFWAGAICLQVYEHPPQETLIIVVTPVSGVIFLALLQDGMF